MPDKLYLNVIRYLNDLYWREKLTPAQIKALASFVLEMGDNADLPEDKSEEIPDSPPRPFDETSQILHELFPGTVYAENPRRL
jgi:hypothetical protein